MSKDNKIVNEIGKAIAYLNEENYSAFMDSLISLGSHLQKILKKNHNKKIEEDLVAVLQNIHSHAIANGIAFRAFEAMWEDKGFNTKASRRFAVKNLLNFSLRHKLKLGLLTIAHCSTVATSFQEERVTEDKAKEIDKVIYNTIQSYKTPSQKVLHYSGKIFAMLVSITFALTMSTTVLLLLPASTPVFLLATSVLLGGTWANWKLLRNAVPHVLNDIAGNDFLFGGFTTFISEAGEKTELTTKKKIALAISILLASSVGVSTSALIFSALMGLPQLAIFSFLATGIGAAILPPVAIMLASMVFVCMTALMLSAFAHALKKEKLSSIFLEPFAEVKAIFEPAQNKGKSPQRLGIEKWVTYIVLTAVTVVSFFGFVMMSYAGTQALGRFLINMVHATPTIARGVSLVVGMGLSLLGQVPFVLQSAARAVRNVATMFRDLLRPSPFAEEGGYLISSEVEKLKMPQKSVLSKAMTGIETICDILAKFIYAVGNGMLMIPSIIRSIGLPLAVVSGAAGFLNSFNSTIAETDADPNAAIKQAASNARISRLLRESDGTSMQNEKMSVNNNDATEMDFYSSFSNEKFYLGQYSIIVDSNSTKHNETVPSRTVSFNLM